MNDTDKHAQLMTIGRYAFESLADMVAALECDYDRLQELRDERDSFEPTDNETWADTNVDDATELAELETAAGDCADRDDAEQRIQEDPLSVEIRSDWYEPGAESEPSEFKILLSTGGPATRIVGELNEHCEPIHATLQVQDWFTPWTDYLDADQDTLIRYCSNFYFGE